MFDNDPAWIENELEQTKKALEEANAKITCLNQSVIRHNQTNGELMDQIACLKEQVAELQQENREYRTGNDAARMDKLDLSKALDFKEAELRTAYEKIGQLETIASIENADTRLVSALTDYVKERIEQTLEARDENYDY